MIELVLLGLFAGIFAFVGYLMYRQLLDHKNSFKNYRHFMHVSMICQTIACIGRLADMQTIEDKTVEGETNIHEISANLSGYCNLSGTLQILFETFGYINLATYLFLLRHSVSNATADLKCLRIKL